MRKTRHHSKPGRSSSICGGCCRGHHSSTWWLDGGPLARVNRVFGEFNRVVMSESGSVLRLRQWSRAMRPKCGNFLFQSEGYFEDKKEWSRLDSGCVGGDDEKSKVEERRGRGGKES